MRHLSLILTILLLLTVPVWSIAASPSVEVNVGRTFNVYGKILAKNASNYRVIAVQKNGAATKVNVRTNGNFKIGLKNRTVKDTTLQMISESGQYQGPILSPRGTEAATKLSGVRSGNLGEITVGKGFATVSSTGRRAFNQNESVDFSSRSGTPGSGKLGLVKVIKSDIKEDKASSKKLQTRTHGQIPGGDTDDDGLINLIDVDDDGDLVLDAADSDFSETQGARPYVFNDIPSEMSASINANAGLAITNEVLDNFIKSYLQMVIGFNSGQNPDIEVGSANVDCSSLPYCGASGVATIVGVGGMQTPSDLPVGTPWVQYDPDNDGFPNLYSYPTGIRREIIIKPNVTTDEIGPGDTLLVKILLNGIVKIFPMVLSSVYATVPAVTSYTDGVNNGTVTYPVPNGAQGTANNPIILSTNNLTLTFWRPQRRTIPGAETGTLIDMGKLRYGVDIGIANSVIDCNETDYTNLSSTLSVSRGFSNDVLLDSKADSVPDSSQTLSFTLNISSCLARAGFATSGQRIVLGLVARDRSANNAKQIIQVQLPN